MSRRIIMRIAVRNKWFCGVVLAGVLAGVVACGQSIATSGACLDAGGSGDVVAACSAVLTEVENEGVGANGAEFFEGVPLGAPCKTSADCNVGSSYYAVCIDEWPAGYCAPRCDRKNPKCPIGSICVFHFGVGDEYCAKPCVKVEDCGSADSYSCMDDNYCMGRD